MVSKAIGAILLLLTLWSIYKLTRYTPDRHFLSIRERQELRRQAHKKPYNPKFSYSPQNKNRRP